jgi:hypothetical protein
MAILVRITLPPARFVVGKPSPSQVIERPTIKQGILPIRLGIPYGERSLHINSELIAAPGNRQGLASQFRRKGSRNG